MDLWTGAFGIGARISESIKVAAVSHPFFTEQRKTLPKAVGPFIISFLEQPLLFFSSEGSIL